MTSTVSFRDWVGSLSEAEQVAIHENLKKHPLAAPQPGPQTSAFLTQADITGFGGAGGGGKSALAALLSIHEHERVVIFRKEKSQLKSLIDDVVAFHGTDKGLNRQDGVFRMNDRDNHVLEWAGLSQPGEELTWRGRPHDLICFEEATEIPFAKVKFVIGWLRSTTPGQRCRILMTFNPPGSADMTDDTGYSAAIGRWVVDFFAAWLSERHPDPAQPGELRYYYRNSEGLEIEKKDNLSERVVVRGKEFWQKPQSRTFIPSLVTDNIYLKDTGYVDHLLSLEEPFRSQMLMGDFRSGIVDAEGQIIKAKWVDEAMDRWASMPNQRHVAMSAMGVDVSRGGANFTSLMRRHDFWWDRAIRFGGPDSDDGPKVANKCITHSRDDAPICIDILGPGSSPHDFLVDKKQHVIAVNASVRKKIPQPDLVLKMFNLRASLWWLLRKILDPANGFEPSLPKDNRLRSELISMHYVRSGETIQVESKKDVIKRLGWSPDDADGVTYSLMPVLSEPKGERLQASRIQKVDHSKLYTRHAAATHKHGWMRN